MAFSVDLVYRGYQAFIILILYLGILLAHTLRIHPFNDNIVKCLQVNQCNRASPFEWRCYRMIGLFPIHASAYFLLNVLCIPFT